MIWKSVQDTKQQNKSHHVPCYTSIPELITKFKHFFHSLEVENAEPRYRRSDSRLCAANLEIRKKTRGERERERRDGLWD